MRDTAECQGSSSHEDHRKQATQCVGTCGRIATQSDTKLCSKLCRLVIVADPCGKDLETGGRFHNIGRPCVQVGESSTVQVMNGMDGLVKWSKSIKCYRKKCHIKPITHI